jgi:hypothetical protein
MFRIIFKSIVALLLASGGLTQAFSQDTYVGVEGGISLPRLSGGGGNEISRGYKSRIAQNIGAFIEIGVNNKFSVQSGLFYAGHGGKRVGVQPIPRPITGLPPRPPGEYYYADIKNVAIFNYMETPVLVKYRFGDDSGKRFYVRAGAFYGLLLDAKSSTSGTSTIYLDKDKTPLLIPPGNQPLPPRPFDAETNIKNDVHKNNFGLTGGAGIEFPRGDNYFFVDARISYGLTTIQKDPVNGSSNTGNLLISVGYAFKVFR